MGLSRSVAFGLFVLMICGALAYSRIVRTVVVPSLMQYVPKEASVLVAFGEIDKLWQAVEVGFGHAIRDPEREGMLAEMLKGIHNLLEEWEINISELTDLERAGLNVRRGGLVALDRQDFLAIFPVTSVEVFSQSLARIFGPAKRKQVPLRPPEMLDATSFGEPEKGVYAAFPSRELAVVSNSLVFLQRGMLDRRENLVYARANDLLYEGVRRHVRGRLCSGPNIFVFWSPPGYAPLQRGVGVLHLREEAIRIEAEFAVHTGGLKTLEDLVQSRPREMFWRDILEAEIPFVAAFQHPTIARIVARVTSEEAKGHQNTWGQLLHMLAEDARPYQLVLAVMRYRHGLPDLLAALRGHPDGLKSLSRRMQLKLREERDRAILQAAIKQFCQGKKNGKVCQENPTGWLTVIEQFCQEKAVELCSPSFPDLQEAGLLVSEASPFLERFPIVAGVIGRPSFAEQDFLSEEYQQTRGGGTITYLAPRLTANDRRYRVELENISDATLTSDRYRLATILIDQVLWIASDESDLPGVLERSAGDRATMREDSVLRAVSAGWSKRDVLQMFMNIERMTTLSLLSGEDDIKKLATYILLDFKQYAGVSVALTPTGDGRRMRLVITVSRLIGS